MIVGHGIDFQEIDAIDRARLRHPEFPKKVLTERELERYQSLQGRRQLEYLAGRWVAKEAFSKAWGTGIGRLGFQDIEVLNTSKGAPYIAKSPFNGQIWISISHSGNFVQASVILEEKDD